MASFPDGHDVPLRLGLALLLGSAIGIERQFQHKMAGLRTNVLVARGAGGFVAFSSLVSGNADPTRIAAQVVFGIGFTMPETARVSITATILSVTRNDTGLEEIAGCLCLEPMVSQAIWQVDRAILE